VGLGLVEHDDVAPGDEVGVEAAGVVVEVAARATRMPSRWVRVASKGRPSSALRGAAPSPRRPSSGRDEVEPLALAQTSSRTATLCTRPADRPWAILRHSSGEIE
jgi:hypothetical protein